MQERLLMKRAFAPGSGFIFLTLITAMSWLPHRGVADAFEQRRDAAFVKLKGEPLEVSEIRPPLGPDRPRFTRQYSFSIVNFATRALWNNEQIKEANRSLRQHSRFYLENPLERTDRDNLHWVTLLLGRILEFFGEDGSIAQRLEPETEALLFEMVSAYFADSSFLEDAQRDPWHIGVWHKWEQEPHLPAPPTSENHHMMKFSTLWHFARLLKDHPLYREVDYNGHPASEHYSAWTAFAKEYIRERAKKGLFVEIAHGYYGPRTVEGLYLFHDFGDAELKRMAGGLLDLYWACWAEEQLGGVRGGGKVRQHQGGQDRVGWDSVTRLAWYYLGIGREVPPGQEMFSVLTSDYRLPAVVSDIALDAEGRGSYEIVQRRMGLDQDWDAFGFYMRPDFGGLLRYSYCTPEFILGLLMHEPRHFRDWAIMSAQNRWQGAIFAGHPDARIFPQARAGPPHEHQRADNSLWGVQKKGTQITQRLPRAYTRFLPEAPTDETPITHGTRVWFSGPGLHNRVEESGWIFIEAEGAYAAVKAARGDYSWTASEDKHDGEWMALHDWFSPIILEVARKVDFTHYQSFQEAIRALPLEWSGHNLSYTGLSGDRFTFDAGENKPAPPTVNGVPVDHDFLSPRKVFHSPFVQSSWNSGTIVIQKGERERVLDFDSADR